MFFKRLLLISSLLIMPSLSIAQESVNSNVPIEISAGQALEWHQKKQQYIARGDVVVTQGDTQIKASEIIADYREGATSKTEIWQLTATNNVEISDIENTVIGDKAIYNVEKGHAIVTGNNLSLTSPDQVITANEKLEYFSNEGKASAVGNAKVVRGTDTLHSSKLTAYFEKDSTGKNQLTKIDAIGNVKIVTPQETLTGDNGTFNAKTNKASVKGNVIINRGPNQLKGARAEVDLTTKVSRIFGNPNNGQRVKGVFFPSSTNTPESN